MRRNALPPRRRRTRNKKQLLLLLLLIGILIIVCILFYKQNQLSSVFGDDSGIEINTQASMNEEEWCLTLVNKWNPITANTDVETVKLSNGQRVDKRIYSFLQNMFDAAKKDGAYPIVASGYRTQQEQEDIYNEKIAEYKKDGLSSEAAKNETELWVAVPGTSEHQLGLAVDINADGIHSKGTEVYDWLEENAHLYGFINRYPSDKTEITGVSNEPWHYRYVGVKAAEKIYQQGVCLEEYLDEVK